MNCSHDSCEYKRPACTSSTCSSLNHRRDSLNFFADWTIWLLAASSAAIILRLLLRLQLCCSDLRLCCCSDATYTVWGRCWRLLLLLLLLLRAAVAATAVRLLLTPTSQSVAVVCCRPQLGSLQGQGRALWEVPLGDHASYICCTYLIPGRIYLTLFLHQQHGTGPGYH